MNRLSLQDRARIGDVWTWTAICADTKLVPSWLVGHRDAFYANKFVCDVAGRLAKRPQVTTDGLKLYLRPIDDALHALQLRADS